MTYLHSSHGDTYQVGIGGRPGRNGVPLRWVAVAVSLLLVSCADVLHTKGIVELKLDNPEDGLESLGKAVKRSPTDAGFKIDYLLTRDEQARIVLSQADELRADGNLEAARALYDRVLKIDPNNARAVASQRGLLQDARSEKLLVDGEGFLNQGKLELAQDRASQALEQNPKSKRAIKLRDAVADATAALEAKQTVERAARYVLDAPVTLQFSNASLKGVFEALAKSTGINFLFDKDVKQESKVTIFVRDVTVSDAIDLMLMQNQLQRRVVNGNTLLIYPANASKQAEYEDLVIKTFQITNADVKYLANMLKSMLKLKDLSADEKTGIMVIRDTPESLRMAERLIAAHDVPDPEIMLEVEVLEVSNVRDSNLGLKPPTGITLSTPGTGSSLTLGALQSLSKDDLIVTPLSATLNFKLEDSDAKILASPRIRARNKETAKIMIGDRVPTITNSVTPLSTGSSVVTGNVTYQDVGLKLEFEPQVYANSEIGIKITLEVSNIAQQFTDNNGGRSYQIGTRNASTNLRLKDGETQILGGLITDQDRNTASKIPGLGHLPIIGRLFGNSAGNGTRSEIVLSITPHIVRNLAVRAPDVQNIFSGTYNVPRERPILADPVPQLSMQGALGGNSGDMAGPGGPGQGGSQGNVLINRLPAAAPTSSMTNNPRPSPPPPGYGNNGMGMSSSPLSPPPPMIQRPASAPK